MSFYEQWIKDIPFQFQDKPNIQGIIRALSRQMDELVEVNNQLLYLTDIENAHGKQLDMCGTIVNVSRNNAYILLNGEANMRIDDEMYRNVLRFQVLKNNSEANYADIMKGLHLLWGDVGITYAECVEEPASIAINIKDITTDESDPAMIRPMVIRPGGVKLFFKSNYLDPVKMSEWEMFKHATLSYVKYRRYNGAHRYDGAIQYAPADVIFRNKYNGEFRYDGTIGYRADNTHYNEFDGSIQYNGVERYGSYFKRKVIELGDAILLNQAKKKMLAMRFNGSDGWQIAGFAFGTGLADDGINEYEPSAEQTGLKNEIYRKELDMKNIVSETCYRYTGGLNELECNGKSISEIGLYDSDGMLLCIKTFPKKKKNKEAEMEFKIDDMC